MAKRLDELPVYQKAVAFCDAVNAIIDRPAVRRNRKTYEQLADANDSILANMDEGFEQSTDGGFANYLTYSKASIAEVISRLHQACKRREVDRKDLSSLRQDARELQRMLGGFINYLRRCDYRDRGTFKAKLRSESPPESGSG